MDFVLIFDQIKEIIGWIGNIASIIGLVITILILNNLRKIHSEYLFKIRSPILLKRLKEYSQNILRYQNDIERFYNEIDMNLSLCGASLKSFEGKVPKNIKKDIYNIRSSINHYLQQPLSYKQKNANEISRKVRVMIEELSNLHEDIMYKGKI